MTDTKNPNNNKRFAEREQTELQRIINEETNRLRELFQAILEQRSNPCPECARLTAEHEDLRAEWQSRGTKIEALTQELKDERTRTNFLQSDNAKLTEERNAARLEAQRFQREHAELLEMYVKLKGQMDSEPVWVRRLETVEQARDMAQKEQMRLVAKCDKLAAQIDKLGKDRETILEELDTTKQERDDSRSESEERGRRVRSLEDVLRSVADLSAEVEEALR